MLSEIKLERVDLDNLNHTSFMFGVRRNPEVAKFLFATPPRNFLEHQEYLKKNKFHRAFFLVKEKDEYVGYAQITLDTQEDIEVGWAIDPRYWGRGLGTAAVNKTIEVVSLWFPINRKIVVYVLRDNKRAIRVYEKCGFKKGISKDMAQQKMWRRIKV